jgi:hypothetical protein
MSKLLSDVNKQLFASNTPESAEILTLKSYANPPSFPTISVSPA